jgi:hypothetical protein
LAGVATGVSSAATTFTAITTGWDDASNSAASAVSARRRYQHQAILAGSAKARGWGLALEFVAESLVGGLELEDPLYAGQVDPGVEEVADLPEPGEVVVAVAASPTVAASRGQQPFGFVQPQAVGNGTD